ncbi:MAG: hypothetical protein WBC70_18660 [Candidatus Aminicenantales bacterium]
MGDKGSHQAVESTPVKAEKEFSFDMGQTPSQVFPGSTFDSSISDYDPEDGDRQTAASFSSALLWWISPARKTSNETRIIAVFGDSKSILLDFKDARREDVCPRPFGTLSLLVKSLEHCVP